MNKSNNHRELYYKIILFLFIISICLNIYLYVDTMKLKEDNLTTSDYLRYVIILKLDRQSDIFYKLSNYTNQVNNDLLTIEEFDLYVSGVKEFLQNDIIYGINEISLKNNIKLKNILKRISYVIATADSTLSKISHNELEYLAENYNKLSLLLNRNKKGDSLTYYILKDDISNPRLKQVLNEIDVYL